MHGGIGVKTGTPARGEIAAVVDLPMPIEPVRPTTSIILPRAGREQGAQIRRHLRPDAEPALEARHRLVQQHAEPVDGLSARARAAASSGVSSGT